MTAPVSFVISFVSRQAAVLALLLCAVAAIAFGARVEGYSHAQYPLAVLGAPQLPDSLWFNVLAFLLPGLLVASVAARLRSRLVPETEPQTLSWSARIGTHLMLLAALAFAAQGVFTLDASELDGAQNGRHAAAWLIWLIASVIGTALLGFGLRGAKDGRNLAVASIGYAILLPVAVLVLPMLFPAGLTQRAAFLLWFAWSILAAGTIARSMRSSNQP